MYLCYYATKSEQVKNAANEIVQYSCFNATAMQVYVLKCINLQVL